MMTPYPLTTRLLIDSASHGIDVQVLGNAIRYRPQAAMTPALLQRLQAVKAELLQLLNTEMVVVELRQSVERLWKDQAWRSAWEQRFKAAHYADFASLRRVLNTVIDLADEHHRRHDWNAFASACRYLHSLASGEEWDKAKTMDTTGGKAKLDT